METITKTGQDMPRKIAILDHENDRLAVRSLPVGVITSEEIEEWLDNNGFHDVEWMSGDFEIDIDN